VVQPGAATSHLSVIAVRTSGSRRALDCLSALQEAADLGSDTGCARSPRTHDRHVPTARSTQPRMGGRWPRRREPWPAAGPAGAGHQGRSASGRGVIRAPLADPDEEHPQRAEPVGDRRGGHPWRVLPGPGGQPGLEVLDVPAGDGRHGADRWRLFGQERRQRPQRLGGIDHAARPQHALEPMVPAQGTPIHVRGWGRGGGPVRALRWRSRRSWIRSPGRCRRGRRPRRTPRSPCWRWPGCSRSTECRGVRCGTAARAHRGCRGPGSGARASRR
jgi:hypothetical protein